LVRGIKGVTVFNGSLLFYHYYKSDTTSERLNRTRDFLKYITQAVFNSKSNNLEGILEIIAKYDYRVLVGANPEIQLSALLAELAKVGK